MAIALLFLWLGLDRQLEASDFASPSQSDADVHECGSLIRLTQPSLRADVSEHGLPLPGFFCALQ